MKQISPELVERMVAHFRAVATRAATDPQMLRNTFAAEAVAIASLFPDADIPEARKIAADIWSLDRGENESQDWHRGRAIRVGNHDDGRDVRIALAAIKRGRELAEGK